MRPIDLVEADRQDFAEFVSWCAHKAYSDHETKTPAPRPLGDSLCNERLEGWRKMHKRLASTIYNQVRESLEAQAREASL